MSEADKALFRGAYDRPLAALVQAQPNNPPVAAYPNFLPGAAAGTTQLVVLRRQIAEIVVAYVVGVNRPPLAGRPSVDIDEASEIPLAFQRGRPLNPSTPGLPVRTGPATTLDPSADPDAEILDAQWISVPTFVMGDRRVGAVTRRTMQFISLRRSAPDNKVVSFGVPIGSVPLYSSDVTAGRSALAAADLFAPAQVPVVMRAVHAYAVSKGYAAGVPGFAEGTQALLQIMFIRDAEIVEPATLRIGGPLVWRCSDLSLKYDAGWIFPAVGNREWDLAGRGTSTHIIAVSAGKLVDSSDLPQPPAYAPVAVDTGGIAPIEIDSVTQYYQVSATDDGLALHVLYAKDDRTMHATRRLSAFDDWATQVVDGDGVDSHLGEAMGWSSALVVTDGPGPRVHAFYVTAAGVLRHAELSGGQWVAESIDGHVADNEGRVAAEMDYPAAAAEPDGRLHVFYYDSNTKDLRHAVRRNGTWAVEILDGAGGTGPSPDGVGTGPISGFVGRRPAAAFFDDRLYVFYEDEKNGNIRMAVRRLVDTTERWSFAPFAGHSRSRGGSRISLCPTVVKWRDRLSVLYMGGDYLYHASVGPGFGMPWRYEIVDGVDGPDGRIAQTVGILPQALAAGGTNGNPDLPLVVAHLRLQGYTFRCAVLSDPA